MRTKDTLKEALAFFGPNGENWTVGIGLPPKKGCALVALGHVSTSGEQYGEARAALHAAIPGGPKVVDFSLSHVSMTIYNDSHDWPDIKAWFERAIEAAP